MLNKLLYVAIVGDLFAAVAWAILLYTAAGVELDLMIELQFFMIHFAVALSAMGFLRKPLIRHWEKVEKSCLAVFATVADVGSLTYHVLHRAGSYTPLDEIVIVFWSILILLDILYVIATILAFHMTIEPEEEQKTYTPTEKLQSLKTYK
jgi:hypothetical protein